MNPSADVTPRSTSHGLQRRHSIASIVSPAAIPAPGRGVSTVLSRRVEALDLPLPEPVRTPGHPTRPPELRRLAISYRLASALMDALKRGENAFAQFLVRTVVPPHGFIDGRPLISNMAKEGHLDILKIMVDRGADIEITSRGSAYNTPLMLAAANGHLEVVKYLQSLGAATPPADSSGFTALMFAAESNHLDVVRHLATFDNVNDVDYQGKSVLMFAAEGGDPMVVRHLCRMHADVYLQDERGASALMCASQSKSAQAGKTIAVLIGMGAQVNQCDRKGDTALMFACRSGNLQTALALLDAGAAIDACNNEGKSALAQALHEAQQAGKSSCIAVIETLVERGADCSQLNSYGEFADFFRGDSLNIEVTSPDETPEGTEETTLYVRVGDETMSATEFFSRLADDVDKEKLIAQENLKQSVSPALLRQVRCASAVERASMRAWGDLRSLRATQHVLATPGMPATRAQKTVLLATMCASLRFERPPYDNSGFRAATVSRLNQRAETELAMLVDIAQAADADSRASLGNLFADCLVTCPEHNVLNAALLKVLLQARAGLIAPLAELVVDSWVMALDEAGPLAVDGASEGKPQDQARLEALKAGFIRSFRKQLDSQAVFNKMRANFEAAGKEMPEALKNVPIDHVAYQDLMVRQLQYLKDYFEALATAKLDDVMPGQ